MITRYAKPFVVVTVVLLIITTLALLHSPSRSYIDPWTVDLLREGGADKELHRDVSFRPTTPGVEGGVIMSKLRNETAKAALGQATWKLLHTMTLRFPESPTQDERGALNSYFHLMARLYPCGECAAELQQLLKKYPPQVHARSFLFVISGLNFCRLHLDVPQRFGYVFCIIKLTSALGNRNSTARTLMQLMIVVVVMDQSVLDDKDFEHDPKKGPTMLRALDLSKGLGVIRNRCR